MGSPILSGALTTIFSGAILIFCTIQIFSKMGIIIVFNLGMAILFALTLFPVLLMLVGPTTQFTNIYTPFKKCFAFIKNKRANHNTVDFKPLNTNEMDL